MNTKEILVIPASTVKFMALNKPVKGFNETDEPKYTIRVEVDGSTAEGQELRAKIGAINKNRINTNNVSAPGNFILSFSSKFPVEVTDSAGQTLNVEDIPRLGKDGTATASVFVTVDYSKSNPKVGAKAAMFLAGVKLHAVSAGTEVSATLADKLKELMSGN